MLWMNALTLNFILKPHKELQILFNKEAAEMKSHDMDFAQRNLFENIETRNFLQWNLWIQIMTEEQANS